MAEIQTQRLRLLNKREKTLLYYISRDKDIKIKDLAAKIYLGESTTRNILSGIYKKLGITGGDQEKRDKLFAQYGHVVRTLYPNLETIERVPDVSPEPESIPAPPIFTQRPPVQRTETPEPQRPVTPRINVPPPEPIRTGATVPIAMAIVVGVVGICCGAAAMWYLLGRSAVPVITARNTNTPWVPTQSQKIEPTATFLPTDTSTPHPTLTSKPTEKFIPPTNGILFYDDFNKGISSEWKISGGKPTIVNGALGNSEHSSSLWLYVGELTWDNYKVEFDCLCESCTIQVGMHVRDLNNMIMLRWNRSLTGPHWNLVSEGRINMIPNTELHQFNNYMQGHAEIQVHDNNYEGNISGVDMIPIWDNTFSTGFVAINLDASALIDNFKITWLP